MEMMFSWLKYRSSFISRSVRKQNIEWSNGVIFLIATFCPEGLCKAELQREIELAHLHFLQVPWSASIREIARVTKWGSIPDNTISSFSYNILDIILLADIERDLSWSRGGIRRTSCHGEIMGIWSKKVVSCRIEELETCLPVVNTNRQLYWMTTGINRKC